MLYTLPKHETVIVEIYTLLYDRFALFQELLKNSDSQNEFYLTVQSLIIGIFIGLLSSDNDYEKKLNSQYSMLYTQLILVLTINYAQQTVIYEVNEKKSLIINKKKEIFLYCLIYCYFRCKGKEIDGVINLFPEYTTLSNIIHNCLIYYLNSNDINKQYLMKVTETSLYLYCSHIHFWKTNNSNDIDLKRDMKKIMQVEIIGKNKPIYEILLRSIGYYLGL